MKYKILFTTIMACITSGLVTLVVIIINKGFVNGFVAVWLKSWCLSFLIAVASILFFGPKVEYLLNNILKQKEKNINEEK